MKFINYLESIAGIGIYPLISLLIFFLFFVALVYYVKKFNKEHIAELENIPLETEEVFEPLNRK
jgi:cytochrome c oxidase cbb3-type subunit 3